jgi:DNA invertase Pin-like site-specific DNA recombinase
VAVIGYVRVSTSKQTTDQQRDALEAFGCDRIFEDIASGARDDRKGLAALLDYARNGDTVVVWRLDGSGAHCPTWSAPRKSSTNAAS